MKNLGVTKGEGVLKIQPRSVCLRALFLFLRIFSGTEANPEHKESKKPVQGAPEHQTPVTFFCFTYVTLFLSKCGYKGRIMHDGWAPSPFWCVTLSWLRQTHKKCKEYALKCVEKKKTTLVRKSLHMLSLALAAFSRCIKKHMGVHLLSFTKTQSKNSDGSHK